MKGDREEAEKGKIPLPNPPTNPRRPAPKQIESHSTHSNPINCRGVYGVVSFYLLEGELALEGERGRLGLLERDVGARHPLAALARVGPGHVQVLVCGFWGLCWSLVGDGWVDGWVGGWMDDGNP